jgi:MFS family permease
LFLLSATSIFISIIICWLLPFSQEKRINELNHLVEHDLQKNKTVVLAWVIFFLTLPYSTVITFLPIYAKQLSIGNIGFFFTIYAIVIFLARPVAGTVADKRAESFVNIPCILFSLCALILLSVAETHFLFGLCAVFLGLGYGTIQPVLQSSVAKTNPSASRGKAMSTFFMGMDLSYGAGPLLFELVVGQMSYSADFFTFAFFVLISLFICFWKYLTP